MSLSSDDLEDAGYVWIVVYKGKSVIACASKAQAYKYADDIGFLHEHVQVESVAMRAQC